MGNVDAQMLAAPFCSATQYGNIVVKEAMIEHLCSLVEPLQEKAPRLVIKHLVPIALHLLGEKKLSGTYEHLFMALHEALGESLLDAVPAEKKRKVEDLLR